MTQEARSLARRGGLLVLAVGVVWLLLQTRPGASPAQAAPAGPRAPAPTDARLWVQMQNVDLHVDSANVMQVRALRGQVVPAAAGTIATLDDPKSFYIRATGGSVALDGAAVTALLNEIVFNYPKSPLRHLTVRIENGGIVQKGTLHKGVNIPFEMFAVPVLLPDGRLRLHPDKLTIFGVNGLVLMHALGLHLDRMMDLSGSHGASVKGDDIFLEPLQIIPPPAVEGRLAAVRVEGKLMVQEFARTADDTIFGTLVRPDAGSKNFVYFRGGGQLRFGKLTMVDPDLLIHDADESDPLDLYFARYNEQLVAGYTKNLPDYGLRNWMIDYAKVHRAGVAAAR